MDVVFYRTLHIYIYEIWEHIEATIHFAANRWTDTIMMNSNEVFESRNKQKKYSIHTFETEQRKKSKNFKSIIVFHPRIILYASNFKLFEHPIFPFIAYFISIHSQADLSCRNTKQSVGVIYTQTNFVTLKYTTDAWGTDTNGFKLVITAVKSLGKYT